MGYELSLLDLIEIEELGITAEEYILTKDNPRFANCELS